MPSTQAESGAPSSRPLWKTFMIFLLPMMGSNVLQSLSGTINNIYLGRMIGVHALSAVSAFFPILFLLISFVIGLGSGASVLIGQAYGANELVRVKAVAGTTLTVTIVLGIVIAAFGGSLTRQILAVLGTPSDIIVDATEYARIFLLSVPLLFVFILYTTITRGVGDTRTPFLALIVANAIGLLLTPALIQGWFGLPRLGVASGAVASIVSFFLTLVWLAVYLLRRRHPLAPDQLLLRQMRIDWRLLGLILKIGVPTGIQVIMLSLSEIAVLKFVNAFGSDATAAYGAVNQVASYVQLPAISIGITVSIFGSQAIGRGDAAGLAPIIRTGVKLQFLITGALILLAYVFSRSVLGLFITSGAVVDIAERQLQITLWSYIVYGLVAVLTGVMRSTGTVFWPMTFSIAAIWLIQVPASYVLSRRIGLDGVWAAYPLAFIVMLISQAAYFQFVWRKKSHTRLV
jgi:putative MATE family efflux protein